MMKNCHFNSSEKSAGRSTYSKELVKWVKKTYLLLLEVVKVRDLPEFTIITMCCKVERTFAGCIEVEG